MASCVIEDTALTNDYFCIYPAIFVDETSTCSLFVSKTPAKNSANICLRQTGV